MKVKSTGLGKTQLQCHFDGFNPKEGGEQSVVMVITSTEPVHWHIEADLGGKDLRQMAGQMLKPRIIWHLIKLLASGSEAKGFVMEKEGGRRSTRERVTREPVVRGLDLPVVEAGPAVEIAADDSGELTSIPGMRVPQPVAAPVAAPIVAAAPSIGGASGNGDTRTDKDSGDLSEREARRAERRKQREEAAKQYATA